MSSSRPGSGDKSVKEVKVVTNFEKKIEEEKNEKDLYRLFTHNKRGEAIGVVDQELRDLRISQKDEVKKKGSRVGSRLKGQPVEESPRLDSVHPHNAEQAELESSEQSYSSTSPRR